MGGQGLFVLTSFILNLVPKVKESVKNFREVRKFYSLRILNDKNDPFF